MMRITKWANYKYSTEVAKTLQVKEDAGGLHAGQHGEPKVETPQKLIIGTFI